jgi:hypothetical protein
VDSVHWSGAHWFADVQHRSFVALALADDDGARDRHILKCSPHGLDGGVVGPVAVALTHGPRGGDRSFFHDTNQFERQLLFDVECR